MSEMLLGIMVLFVVRNCCMEVRPAATTVYII